MEERQIEVADGKTMNFKPSDVCGTLLTNSNFTGAGVQLIKEQVNRIGGLYDTENQKRQAGSIYDKEGLAPTLDTASGGHRQPLIWERYNNKALNETLATNQVESGDFIDAYNRAIKKDIAGTITTRVSDANQHFVAESAYGDAELQLFTEDGNIRRYVGSEKIDEFKEGQMATTSFPNGYGHGPRTHNESISLNTIDRPSVKQNYRIRKLTPKECGRLMGVRDDEIDKMSVNQSNSKLYHLYGDSIVVDVLMEIFGQMI